MKDAVVYSIIVRAHSYYIYKLIDTKPLHAPQDIVTPFKEHADGLYGEFAVQVELNNEFIGRILQMGPGLEIMSPSIVREEFAKRVKQLADLYNKTDQDCRGMVPNTQEPL